MKEWGNNMRNQIIARLVMAFVASFISIENKAADLGEFSCIPGALKELDFKELNLSLVGYSAKNLPPGLKLNKTTGFINGKATKPGTYQSTFTKKNADTHTAKFTVEPLRTIEISMEGDTDKCKVSGATKPNQGYLVGKSITLSATCPKGIVFTGWLKEGEVWPDKSQYLEPRLKYVVTEENLSLVARFEKETIKDKGSYGPYIPGTDVEESLGLVGYSVKNLPIGLKFDKKTGVVKGKPTKPGTYISTFTKQYLQTYTVKFIVDSLRTIKISMEGDTYQCKVSGATKSNQGHLVGKTVTLSATAPKGTAFMGWFKDEKPWPDESKYLETRLKYVVTEDNLSLVARFKKEEMSVLCNGLLKPINAYSQLSTPIIIETMSGVKSVTASKLPTGLKVIKDKSNGMWYIQGNPKKIGVWSSIIKVTANSGAVKELSIKITVNDGIIGGGNLTDANGYFKYGLDNGEGEKYVLSMDPSDIGKILPNLTLSSPSATLEVSGLPDGLTYDRTTGRINGTANKTGSYTVTLTVTDRGSTYISTITIIMGAPDNACDLLVSSITATRTAVYIGEKFNLRYVIKNDSKFDSQFFKNKIITPDGYNVIEHSCSGLAQKDTVAFRTQIDSGLLGVGKYVITILTDSNESNIESDETNNKKTITLEVLELPPTNSLVDWDFKAKAENEKVGAVFLSKASAPLVKASQFNRGEVIYAQINFWNNLHQLVPHQVTASALLDTGVNTSWYWYGLDVDVIGYIPDQHRRAPVLQGLQPGVYTLEILLDSDRFVNSKEDFAYYPEADKLNNSSIIEFTVAGDYKVVTFDPNGGELTNDTMTLTKGSCRGETPIPTLKGYKFAGWHTAKDGGIEITKETIISKDITVYAKWMPESYKVRFYMNDGKDDNTEEQSFITGEESILTSINDLEWGVEGYKFAGWATSSSGEVKYSDGEMISYIKTDDDNVAHLYAVWIYDVILHKNDGSGTFVKQICRLKKDQSLFRIDEDLGWRSPDDSLLFAGWATSPEGSVKYKDGDTVDVPKKAIVDLYAIWGGTGYTVRFNKSLESNITKDQKHTVGFSKKLTTIAELGWEIEGYQFAGWSTVEGGKVEFKDGQEVKDLTEQSDKVFNLYAVWTYEVILHKNDGTGATKKQTCTLYNNQNLWRINEDLEWDNPNDTLSFIGWATSPNGTVKYSDGAKVESSTTLYAIWGEAMYTVRFHKSSDSAMTKDQIHTIGFSKKLTTIAELEWEIEGCQFAGWSTVEGGDVEFTDGQEVKDITDQSGKVYNLYAVWTYEVVLHKNDGSGITEICTLRKNQRLLKIDEDLGWEDPTDALSFVGWATSPNGAVKYDDGALVDGSTTLYAIWGGVGYTIRFHKSSDSAITKDQKHTVGFSKKLITISELGWAIDGYKFAGWSTVEGGDVEFKDGQEVKDLTEQADKVFHLYAVWTCEVVLHKNDGSNVTKKCTLRRNQHLLKINEDLKWDDPTDLLTFVGWATSPNGTIQYDDGDLVNTSMDLYAIWSEAVYTVRFHKSSDSALTKDQHHTIGVSKKLTTIAELGWEIDGYQFAGWSTIEGRGVEFEDGEVIKDITDQPGKIYNLYAVWTFKVVFHKSAGSDETDEQVHQRGREQNLYYVSRDLGWSVSGSKFVGWATTEGGEVRYPDGFNSENIVPKKPEIHLYAVWSKDENSYIVEFHKNSPLEVGEDTSVIKECKIGENIKPSVYNVYVNTWKEQIQDYNFAGWATSSDGGVTYTNGYDIAIKSVESGSTYHLYAVWKQSQYTIILHSNDGTDCKYTITTNNVDSIELPTAVEDNWGWETPLEYNQNEYDSDFVGWSTKKGKNSECEYNTDNNVIDLTSNEIKLYAVWNEPRYSIKFHKNDGTDETITKTFIKGGTLNLSWGGLDLDEDWGWWLLNGKPIDIINPQVGGSLVNSLYESADAEFLLVDLYASREKASVANAAQYAMKSVVVTTTTNASFLDSLLITGQFVEDFAFFELLLDEADAAITSGRFTEYCEEGVITSECDVERIKDSLIITQDNRIILIKISNGVATAEIIID